ncbi:MAG TPA: hypothetical protein VK961_01775 [Chthoniobacter sp.]|nr:hypothetical protein [Chthoniobacter sp.]
MTHCYSSRRAACKQWSAALAVIILLVGGMVGLHPTKMMWAAGPLVLIGLVEAGFAGQEKRFAELLTDKNGNAEMVVLQPEAGIASVLRTTFAALSLSIWPFYLTLFALVAVGGAEMASIDKKNAAAYAGSNGLPGQAPMQTYFPAPMPSRGGYQPMLSPQMMPQQSLPQYRQPAMGNTGANRPPAIPSNTSLVRTVPAPLQPKNPPATTPPSPVNKSPQPPAGAGSVDPEAPQRPTAAPLPPSATQPVPSAAAMPVVPAAATTAPAPVSNAPAPAMPGKKH